MADPKSLPGKRLAEEARFHDRLFTDGDRAVTAKFYTVAAPALNHYLALIDAYGGRGCQVLELGCGTGRDSLRLARHGARVVGVDVSREGLRRAATRAREEGFGPDNPTFRLMNAEALTFPPTVFDLVIGSGVVHHLDLDALRRQLPRLLKPTGHAVFHEPLGHNPLLNLYRRLTPTIRTPDERPLSAADLDVLSAPFREVRIRYHILCSLMAVPLRALPGHRWLLAVLESIDRALLRLPFVQRLAWQVVVDLGHPDTSN